MYARKRRVLDLNGSLAVLLPPGTPIGRSKEATMVGDRLLWVDPEGEHSPEDLLEVLKEFDLAIQQRLREKRAVKAQKLQGG